MRLARARGGNTLALMAAALIPMSALAGSAVDMARLYVVKVRLQQACDAGALAGRKFMADTDSATLDDTASQRAKTFFTNNFREGWMTTNNVSFTPSKTADSQVAAVAQATVPMTLMKMFGYASSTLNVTCQARYDIADTDIMFVLDTTGSMACTTSDSDSDCNTWVGNNSGKTYVKAGATGYYVAEKPGSKIAGVRSAVLSFYDTVAANVDSSTHVRYGFVPYSSAVNVGKVLYSMSPSYLVSGKWNYQSRVVTDDFDNGKPSSYGDSPYRGVSQSTCNSYNGLRNPTTGWKSDGTAIRYNTSWAAAGSTCTITQQPLLPLWTYQQTQYDVGQYVTGVQVDDPSKVDNSKSTWAGCIEERDTTASSSFSTSNLPADLDPDRIPTSDATRWRPHWPDVIYWRGTGTGTVTSGGDSSTYYNVGDASHKASGFPTCGKEVKRLKELSRSDVSNYVNDNDFRALGGTYHDTGMIWGTRMISPGGIFKDDTAAWPGRQTPNRYIVFMTDGAMAPSLGIYGQYGIEQYDQRVTGGSFASQKDYHNARFVAECAAAKARNIKVFVVGFGQTLNSQLTACASPGEAYYASDNASLTAAFQTIAKQVARLRLSQ